MTPLWRETSSCPPAVKADSASQAVSGCSGIITSSAEIHPGIGGATRQVINKVDEVLKNSNSLIGITLENVMTCTFSLPVPVTTQTPQHHHCTS